MLHILRRIFYVSLPPVSNIYNVSGFFGVTTAE